MKGELHLSKRRSAGEGCISQRKDGYWVGYITLGYENGKQKRRTVSAKSRSEVANKLNEIKTQVTTQTYTEPNKITFGNYLDLWLVKKATLENCKPSTIQTHKVYIKNRIRPALGNIPIQKLTTKIINDFYAAELGRKNNKGTTCKPITIHRLHNVIHNALKHAKLDKLVVINVANDALLPKITPMETIALDDAEIKKIIEAAKKYQSFGTTRSSNGYPAVILAMGTGMRRGEICGLTWDNVRLDKGIVKVTQTILDLQGKLIVSTPKSKESRRTISIGPNVIQALAEHQDKATGQWVFPSVEDMNKPWPPNKFYKAFRGIIKLAELKIRLHDLRHTHATQLIHNGVDLDTVQKRMGHADITTTALYLHRSQKLDKQAGNLIDSLMMGTVGSNSM